MPQTWPSTLQAKINESGFSRKKGDTLLRTEMEVGIAKVRRRYTKGINELRVSIWVTQSQFNDFETFYDTTLAGGVLSFNFVDPITKATKVYRFKAPPETDYVGGETFAISMTWEEIPT